MGGSIRRIHESADFLAVNPNGEEISLYCEDPNGEESLVKAANLGGFDNIQCFGHSKQDLTAVGQINGTTCVFDIRSPSILKLRPKQSRPCNDLSFNTTGLLALGFDKGRQDSSLQIWDVGHFSNSGKNDHIPKPYLSYIQNEVILSTEFHPQDPYSLLAGSYKFLRGIDTRVAQPAFQVASRWTSGIRFDPMSNNYFASHGEDGTLAIWDYRKLSASGAPLLTFPKLLDDSRKGGTSCFRYSCARAGEFAALFNGELIRRWQTGVVPSEPNDSLFVASVLDAKTKFERVVSFDYAPSDHGVDLVCLRQSGTIFRMHAVESQRCVNFSPLNDVSFAGSEGAYIESRGGVAEGAYMENRGTVVEEEDEEEEEGEDGEDGKGEDDESVMATDLLSCGSLLSNDACGEMRHRALLGYANSCEKNQSVVEGMQSVGSNLHLRNTWRWLSISQEAASKGEMVSGVLDLGFEGVLGIWNGVSNLQGQRRHSGSIEETVFAKAVKEIVSRRAQERSIVSMIEGLDLQEKSDRESQRQLCLSVAGWSFTKQVLSGKLEKMIKAGHYEKAAGWAVFHGDIGEAVKILSKAKDERLHIISTAIAGYLTHKDMSVNSPWKDQCRKLAAELDDPYLRSIFAFIADNNWWDVLDESALPLREKLGIALRFLSDKDLTLYLNRISRKVVSGGELEGIILTGVTPKGIELLQSYVDRTSDVQTASLIASFGCPRYFKDERVDHWISSYRELLNSWGLFNVRAKFDVARTKLSKTNSGKITTNPVPRQVFLQCSRCNKNIARPNKNAKLFSQPKSITCCPHCGAALPKCAICLLPQGMPLPGDVYKGDNKTFGEWFSFCLSCNHSMHASHAEEWFSKHYVCAVPDCHCRCNSL